MSSNPELEGMPFGYPYISAGCCYQKQIVIAYDVDARQAGVACYLAGPPPDGFSAAIFERYEHPDLPHSVLRLTRGRKTAPGLPMLKTHLEWRKPASEMPAAAPRPTAAHVALCPCRKLLGVEEVLALLRPPLAIFTGAGISTAAGINDLNGIRESFGLTQQVSETNRDEAIRRFVEEPEALLKAVEKFLGGFHFAPPTRAHRAVHQIQQALGVPVMTENEDTLHQRCGTQTLTRRDWPAVERAMGNARSLLVLGIGLNHQPAASFIQEFRRRDTDRSLVGIALECLEPTYLQTADAFLAADLEDAVPHLGELLLGSARQ